MQRHRKEQALRRLVAALERAHECFVQHALVRRMLVDQHHALFVLEHQVAALKLHERRHAGRRSLRRDSRRCVRTAGASSPADANIPPSNGTRLQGVDARGCRAAREPVDASSRWSGRSSRRHRRFPSARRTAASTVCSTCHRSRKRTSALAGCTLTSTMSAATTMSRKSVGRTPAGIVERYAASAARTMPMSRTDAPVDRKKYAPRCQSRHRPAARRAPTTCVVPLQIVDVEEPPGECRAVHGSEPIAQRRRRRKREHGLAAVRERVRARRAASATSSRPRRESRATRSARRAGISVAPVHCRTGATRERSCRAGARCRTTSSTMPARRAHERAGAIVVRGLDLEMRDGRDRRERLAAETEAPHADEILRRPDLRRRVPLEARARRLRATCRIRRRSPAACSAGRRPRPRRRSTSPRRRARSR